MPPSARVQSREPTASHSNNTNSFAILDRAADQVKSSRFDRQRPLIILNQILNVSALQMPCSSS
eukprot:8983671-Pyramimonas_sp.AAC.1